MSVKTKLNFKEPLFFLLFSLPPPPLHEDAYPVASLCEQKKAVALFFVSHFRGVSRGCYGLQMSPCIAFGGSHSLVLSGRDPPLLSCLLSWVQHQGGVCTGKPHRVDTNMASKWGRNNQTHTNSTCMHQFFHMHTWMQKHDDTNSCDYSHRTCDKETPGRVSN